MRTSFSRLLLALALACSLATSGCRKCDWPVPLTTPDFVEPRSLDWSNLKLAPVDAYVSLRSCRSCQLRSRFLAIVVRPLPSALWREGAMIEASVDGGPLHPVMMMGSQPDRIFLYGPLKGEHEITLVLTGPDGEEIDRHTLRVGRETWKQRRTWE